MDRDFPPAIERYMIPTVVILESGCWYWTGSVKAGYGEVHLGGKVSLRAHRVFYEAYKGKITDDLCVDHTCCEKLCVNPDHLELVTRAENNQRAAQRKAAKAPVRWTQGIPPRPGDEDKFCLRGHPYIGNRRQLTKGGGTYCIECNNEASRQYAKKKRLLK